jgi:F-type H+-transporting ATPase subunit delta
MADNAAQDADQQGIATTYAKALLGATQRTGSSFNVLEELESLVNDVLAHQPAFATLLGSPRVSAEEKIGLIDKVFGNRVSGDLSKFLKVVARHGRLGSLRPISRAYRKLYNEANDRVEVTVTTAAPLAADQRGQVTAALEAKLGRRVDLREAIDEKLIGGMVVRTGDTVYDASIANRLNRQKEQAIRNSIAKLQSAAG